VTDEIIETVDDVLFKINETCAHIGDPLVPVVVTLTAPPHIWNQLRDNYLAARREAHDAREDAALFKNALKAIVGS
jgi:hypothetical protein